NITNPAEAGTLLIEFGTLSKLTHRPVFFDKAKRALTEIYNRRSPIGLVGTWINVETGKWTDTDSHISGAIDSYYEYLLKCWLLFGDEDCHRMWQDSIAAINKYLADDITRASPLLPGSPPQRELWYGHADMNTGKSRPLDSDASVVTNPTLVPNSRPTLRAFICWRAAQCSRNSSSTAALTRATQLSKASSRKKSPIPCRASYLRRRSNTSICSL